MTTLNQYVRLHKHVVTLGASVALVCTAYSLWKWTASKPKDQTVYKSVKDNESMSKEHNEQRAVKQSQNERAHDEQIATDKAANSELKEAIVQSTYESDNITITTNKQHDSAVNEIGPVAGSYVLAEKCLTEEGGIDDLTASSGISESIVNVTAQEELSGSVSELVEQFELLEVQDQTADSTDDETNQSDSATTVAEDETCAAIKPTEIPTIEKMVDFNDCHNDELSSIKSNSLSAATSSNGDLDIHTPEHEQDLNTNNISLDNNSNTKHLTDNASQVDTLPTATHISTAINNIHFSWNDSLRDYKSPNSNISEITSTGSLPQVLPTNESINNALQNVKEHANNIYSAFPADNTSDAIQDNTDVANNDLISASPSSILSSSSLTPTAPEFVPRSMKNNNYKKKQSKKLLKKHLSREQLIEQQRQHNTPKARSRCSHWPFCTNNNCKFVHPYKPCRAGDECIFGNKCMFLHPSDM